MFFVLLRPIFCEKWKIAPPIRKQPPLKRLKLRNWEKNRPKFWRRPFFFFFFFFGDHLILGGKTLWILDFGRKITLNFGEDLFFFFGDHLILGGKTLWILDFGRKITLNFGEDLFFFFFFFGDHLILGGKTLWILDFGRKITLNFGEDLFFFFFFFGDHLILGGKTFEFPIFPRHFDSNFGQTVWNWFKVNENSSQRRLHTSHSFKIAPPFSKSWLRAWRFRPDDKKTDMRILFAYTYVKKSGFAFRTYEKRILCK